MSAYNLYYFGKTQRSAAHDEQLAKARIARWSNGSKDLSRSNKENTSPPPNTHRLPPNHCLRQEARMRSPPVASEAATVSMTAKVTPAIDTAATQPKSRPGTLKRHAVDGGQLSTEIKKQCRQIDTLRKEKDSFRKKAARQRLRSRDSRLLLQKCGSSLNPKRECIGRGSQRQAEEKNHCSCVLSVLRLVSRFSKPI